MPKGCHYQECVPDFVAENIYNLRKARCARYLTRNDLADRTGVSSKAISSYENMLAYPKQGNYNKLAFFFAWEVWK